MPDIDPISLEIVDDGGQSVNMNLHLSGDYYSLQAEAWAVGQKNGVDVPATDPTYHNNSKYYALAAQHAVGAPIINETAGPGDIVTFDDGADDLPLEQLKVSMAPVQDLHGYDSPWVGGAGKNLLPDTGWTESKYITGGGNVSNATDQDVSDFVPVKASTAYTYSGVNLHNNGSTSDVYIQVAFYDSSKTFLSRPINSQSGNSTFNTTSETAYIRVTRGKSGTQLQIEEGSTATDFAPYANICPITGWDGVEVSRTGKNVFDTDVAQLTSNTNITVDGETQSNKNNRSATVGYIRLKPETNYTISYSGATNNGVFYYKADKTFISYVSWEPSGRVFTTPAETAYARFSFAESNPPSNIQVEEGSTATAYEDSAQTYSISFPSSAGTVYGGTLTINRDGSGSLVVDRGLITIDGTETFIDVTSANVFYAVKDSLSAYGVSTADDYCNVFKPVQASGSSYMSDGDIARQTTNNNRLFVKSSRFAGYTASQLATYFASNNLQICLKLATPVSYSLTANQVHTLLGYNVLWADAGQVEVTYPADTKLYIDNFNQPATGVSF